MGILTNILIILNGNVWHLYILVFLYTKDTIDGSNNSGKNKIYFKSKVILKQTLFRLPMAINIDRLNYLYKKYI